MDMSGIIIIAALASILANFLKVWEFVSSKPWPTYKKNLLSSYADPFHRTLSPPKGTAYAIPLGS